MHIAIQSSQPCCIQCMMRCCSCSVTVGAGEVQQLLPHLLQTNARISLQKPWTQCRYLSLRLQDVTPAQVGYGSFCRTIWQIVALWDGRVVGHGAAVKKMAAKKMASEVRNAREVSGCVSGHMVLNGVEHTIALDLCQARCCSCVQMSRASRRLRRGKEIPCEAAVAKNLPCNANLQPATTCLVV